MGYTIARAARDAGAAVTLISGPVTLDTPEGVERISVESARDMLAACEAQMDDCDIFIGCAAVADYRPKEAADQKLKKSGDDLTLSFTQNPDILATIAQRDNAPFCVGFAAETEKLAEHAQGKLDRKKLQLIVANDVSDSSIGFNSDSNAATFLWRENEELRSEDIERCSKDTLARILIERISGRFPRS